MVRFVAYGYSRVATPSKSSNEITAPDVRTVLFVRRSRANRTRVQTIRRLMKSSRDNQRLLTSDREEFIFIVIKHNRYDYNVLSRSHNITINIVFYKRWLYKQSTLHVGLRLSGRSLIEPQPFRRETRVQYALTTEIYVYCSISRPRRPFLWSFCTNKRYDSRKRTVKRLNIMCDPISKNFGTTSVRAVLEKTVRSNETTDRHGAPRTCPTPPRAH